jgi:hypothetical protein
MFVYITFLWRGAAVETLVIEGDSERSVTGTCVVAYEGFEIMPGVLEKDADHIGWWRSNVSTDPLTAWRTARLLAKVRQLRQGHDQTIGALVACLENGNCFEQLERFAEDFAMSTGEFIDLFTMIQQETPLPDELEGILRALAKVFDNWDDVFTQYLAPLEQLEAEGVVFTEWVTALLNETRRRRERRLEQERIVQEEIDAPVAPEESLGQLLADLGAEAFIDYYLAPERIDAATLDGLFKAATLGRQVTLPRIKLARQEAFLPTVLGWIGIRVGNERVVVYPPLYTHFEGSTQRQFLIEAFVVGDETSQKIRTIPQFRQLVGQLGGFSFVAGTPLLPSKKKRLPRFRC